MKKATILLLMIALSFSTDLTAKKKQPKTITVAVIDTGIDLAIKKQAYKKGICKFGHKDFTGTGLADIHEHGTNISGLIHMYTQGANYCQVILKYYLKNSSGKVNLRRLKQALQHAIALKVDVINISLGGPTSDDLERTIIKKALDQGIIIVAAAGNENQDIKKFPYYPASYYPKIIVVGNGKSAVFKRPSSNYGTQVDIWEMGVKVKGSYGTPMSGTSQAAAIITGRVVQILYAME